MSYNQFKNVKQDKNAKGKYQAFNVNNVYTGSTIIAPKFQGMIIYSKICISNLFTLIVMYCNILSSFPTTWIAKSWKGYEDAKRSFVKCTIIR